MRRTFYWSTVERQIRCGVWGYWRAAGVINNEGFVFCFDFSRVRGKSLLVREGMKTGLNIWSWVRYKNGKSEL